MVEHSLKDLESCAPDLAKIVGDWQQWLRIEKMSPVIRFVPIQAIFLTLLDSWPIITAKMFLCPKFQAPACLIFAHGYHAKPWMGGAIAAAREACLA